MGLLLLPLGLIAVTVLVATGYGALTLRALGVEPGDRLEGVLHSLALGLGIIAYATLALAALGLLHPAAYLIIALGSLAGVRQVNWILGVRNDRDRMPAWGWAVLSVCFFLLCGELLKLAVPPVGGDQTKYQLVYPKLFAQAGGLVETPWSFWGNVQYLVNWLFTAAFVVEGDVLARLIHALLGLLAALAIYGCGRSYFGAPVSLVAAGVFFTAPITTTLMTQAWVDLGVVFYTMMALWAFVRWWREGKGCELILAGILAGLAGATKPLGLATSGILGLGIVGRLLYDLRLEAVPKAVRRRIAAGLPGQQTTAVPAASRWLTSGFAFACVTLLAASPCYLRNLISTGNPVYPFAYGIFGGRAWSPQAASYLDQYYRTYRAEHATKRPADSSAGKLSKAAKMAWNLTMYPSSYERTSRAGYDLSPFLLACLPGAILLVRNGVGLGLLSFGVAYALVVSQAWPHPRYLLPGLAPLLLVCASALVTFFRGSVGRRIPVLVAVTTIGVSTLLSAQMLAWRWRDDLAVVTGEMTQDQYLKRYDKRYPVWNLVNSQVPADGLVLVLDKIPHPYHMKRAFISGSYLEQGLIDYHAMSSPEELLQGVLRLGVTHVVHPSWEQARDPFEAHVFSLWRGFIGRFCRLISSSGEVRLYAVSPPGEVTHSGVVGGRVG